MKILVGVKMVPVASSVQFVPGINRIDRDAGEQAINPPDRHALAAVLQLARAIGAEVVVTTMGPPAARVVLDDALAAGATRAVHLMDMRFAGADTLATARVLAQLCRREAPDLVVFGHVATDGGTAQVAPQVAELTGLPVVTEGASLSIDGAQVVLQRHANGYLEHCTLSLPAVVSLDHPGSSPAAPDWTGVSGEGGGQPVGAMERPVETLDADGLGGDDAGYGIRGSATYVQRIDPIEPRHPHAPVLDPEAAAARLWMSIGATKPPSDLPNLPDSAEDEAGPTARAALDNPTGDGSRSPRPQLWAIVDGCDSGPDERAGRATIAAAAAARASFDADVVAVVLGGNVDDSLAATLGSYGADRVLVLYSQAPDGLATPEAVADALAPLVSARAPLAVIGPWSVAGRHYVPRIAARLQIGCTGDVIGLDAVPRNDGPAQVDLVWLKPAWSGTVIARVVARTACAMGTLRPRAVSPLRDRGTRVAVDEHHADLPAEPTRRPQTEHSDRSSLELADASVVWCVGSAAGPYVRALRSLCGRLGWAIGGTRRAVEHGLVEAASAVDLGRWALSPSVAVIVCPDDPEDLAALRGAGTLFTVDPDPGAASHALADVPLACSPAALLDAVAARWPQVSCERAD